jgi:hypothetical protein
MKEIKKKKNLYVCPDCQIYPMEMETSFMASGSTGDMPISPASYDDYSNEQ